MSQFVRDARINMLYEGANGVQALDLVGRKLGAKGGKPVMGFGMMIKAYADSVQDDEVLGDMVAKPLLAALGDFQAACQYIMQNGMKDPTVALAGSTDFLHLMGQLILGYLHGRRAEAAQAALAEGAGDAEFYQHCLVTSRHYLTRQVPMTRMHLKRLQAGPETIMSPAASAF